MTRDEAIKRIRKALKERSGRAWSVTGGRGTGYGWIRIDAPPARCTWRQRLKEGARPDGCASSYEWADQGEPGGHMSPEECAELTRLFGLERPVHFQGLSIPASGKHREWYVARAEGREAGVHPEPYWD